MRIFAIGDLHLPGHQAKPMDIFGAHWNGHFEKIQRDWKQKVSQEDVVLLPGDFSWAMTLEEAADDLQAVASLPGEKILIKGNHDFWWNSLTKVKRFLPQGMNVLQNSSYQREKTAFCGTRGWLLPQEGTDEDQKIFQREVIRIKLSLDSVQMEEIDRMIVMTHFPPVNAKGQLNPFMEMILQYPKVTDIVYGHLHGEALKSAFQGSVGGVRLHCASCDGLSFRLMEI